MKIKLQIEIEIDSDDVMILTHFLFEDREEYEHIPRKRLPKEVLERGDRTGKYWMRINTDDVYQSLGEYSESNAKGTLKVIEGELSGEYMIESPLEINGQFVRLAISNDLVLL